MRRCLTLATLFFVFISCSTDYNASKKISDFIPNTSNLIFKVNALNDFKSIMSSNLLVAQLDSRNFNKLSLHLNYINTTEALFIATNSSKKNNFFSLITKNHKDIISTDSTLLLIKEKIVEPDIYRIIHNNDTLFHRSVGNVFFGSNSLELVKSANTSIPDEKLTRLIETLDDKETVSVVTKNESTATNILFLNSEENKQISEYSVVDFKFQNNGVLYNGVTKGQDSTYFINSFKNTIPQELKLSEIIPEEAASFKRVAFDDYSVFSKNSSEIKHITHDSSATFLNIISEIGVFKINNGHAVATYALDADILSQTLINNTSKEIYKEVKIYDSEDTSLFKNKLAPFLSYNNANHFFVFENFAVFSDQIETLKTIISNKLNNKTLSNLDSFKNIIEDLADESSYMIYKDKTAFNKLLKDDKVNYTNNAVQLVYDNNFAHINGSLKQYKTPAKQNSVSEQFSFSFPNDLIVPPQIVKNHISKANEIATQDVNNILYLISNTGNLLWKKQLDSKILGKIKQIDTYKNGRLQLTFATQNRVYILDRNGKDVGPFPLKFNDAITQPLSVFDYDNKKNYRLLVTQNKSLLMYDVKGKKINGFKPKRIDKPIRTQPKHFRITSKDYIVFTQGEKLEILNRQGKTRIDMKDKIRFSKNTIYLYQNKFTTTNTIGELIQVNTKGELNKKALNLIDNHSIEATSKTLVTLSDNKLTIRSRSIDLEYGEYTAPKIFYFNDKIYVTITDLQAKKVHLFDSQTKPIANFPVFGTSDSEIQLNKDKSLMLVTQTDAKTISAYTIN